MPGQTKTINKVFDVLKWVVGGLSLITAFIPGLQPVAGLLGLTSGAMGLSSRISNMIQQKREGTLTTANKIGNISNIVGRTLGMVSPLIGIIGSETSNVIRNAVKVISAGNSIIGNAAIVPNMISQTFRKRFLR
jgi:hypothetical protein